MHNYNILFVLSFIGTSFLTLLLVKVLPFFGLVDIPDQRRAHNKVTPRGGGLAIVIMVIMAASIYEYFLATSSIGTVRILGILLVISMVSFLDDLIHIPVVVRLITHVICSVAVVILFLSPALLFHNELPPYLDVIVSIVGLTAFLNIYNFLDGIDGITCSESIHLSITILILCYLKSDIIMHANLIIILNVIILGSSIGFLLFNWQPAKIFLGDIGSISLGFLLGFSLLLISASSAHLFVASVIASLYYLADGGLTILIRLINREKIWQPHLKHFFQKAVQKRKTHRQVVSRIALCNLLLMVFSITSLYFPVISIILAILTVMITIINFAINKKDLGNIS
ncbi:MAG: glycosyltransferase family 4 protein [Rickettsia endosymbiont of Bryobia graminum]|nr:glycosyltransferase family 4 protein [Rickettsia endosymbiont of Bryobia graminum]